VSPILESIGSVKGFGWGGLREPILAFESIATVNATGSSSTLTFSSIPSTYKHLQIRGIAKSTFSSDNGNSVLATFNSDSGANYSWHNLYGTSGAYGEGAASANFINVRLIAPSNGSSLPLFGVVIFDIIDYASTSKYKTARYFGGTDSNGNSGIVSPVEVASGLWQSTSAINSITLTSQTLNFDTGSTFALYGIKG
jgi:hypothetical protein